MDRARLAWLELAEDPGAWSALGFAVDAQGRSRIGATELRLTGGAGGIVAWGLDGVAGGDLDGLRTSAAPAGAGDGDAHPNGVVAIDHIVVSTPDLARTCTALQHAGLELRATRDAGPTARQAFFLLRECLVEVVGPREPDGDGPAALWGLTLVSEDLATTAAVLGDRLGRVKDAVQPGRRIATLRREGSGVATPVAFMTPRR